jgi:hypothetical protein
MGVGEKCIDLRMTNSRNKFVQNHAMINTIFRCSLVILKLCNHMLAMVTMNQFVIAVVFCKTWGSGYLR